MIIQGHRQSGFKTTALRARGWYALSGLGQLGQVLCPGGVPCAGGLPNFNEEQWYELIALTSNQPLASVQATYSQIAPGQDYGGQPYFAQKAPLTNLQIALGQWPGGIAHSGYLAYQQGNIVDAPQGGHYFQYGGAWVGTAPQIGADKNNPWAIPVQQPTTQQVQAATTAMFSQYQQAMAAPVYSQPQNPAAVIAAYNASNPQAPVALGPTPVPTAVSSVAPTVLPVAAPVVVNPSPPSQSTSTGTAATSTTSAVSQANGQPSSGTSTVNQGTFDLTSLFRGTDWIPGIPNVALVIGAAGALVLLIAGSKGR